MWLLYELPVFQAVNTLCPKIRTLTPDDGGTFS